MHNLENIDNKERHNKVVQIDTKEKTTEPVTTQEPVETPVPVATPSPLTTQETGTTPEPIATQEPEATPKTVEEYFEATPVEDMKKEAVKEVNTLYNALAKVTVESITSKNNIINNTLYSAIIDKNLIKRRFDKKFGKKYLGDLPESIREKKLLEEYRKHHREILESIVNDIRFTVVQMNWNDNNWRFSRFEGDTIVLKHDFPANTIDYFDSHFDFARCADKKQFLSKYYPNNIIVYREPL